jgi:L-2-hydroxyglutarate oxidase LhgO
MNSVDAVVIGAGVVGLASARALAQSGRQVVVVERHRHIGTETSSRNSGVIHSGIYYPSGSAKAVHCVRGRERLYEYCATRGVAQRRCV